MKFTLAELIPFPSIIKREISYLQSKVIENSSFKGVTRDEVEKGNVKEQKELFDSYLERVEEASEDLEKVQRLIDRTNSTTMVDTDFGELSIKEALLKANEMRSLATLYRRLSEMSKFEMITDFSSHYFQKTVYDPEEMRSKTREFDNGAQKLSNAIENANNTTRVEAEFLEKYM